MTFLIDDDLLARAPCREDRALVGEYTGWHVGCSLFTKQVGCVLLQSNHCGILIVSPVAVWRAEDCIAHLRSQYDEQVRTELNVVHCLDYGLYILIFICCCRGRHGSQNQLGYKNKEYHHQL